MMSSTEKINERNIRERILAGERDLFRVLIRQCNAILYRTGRSYGYNHEDTQDLMQDAFVEAYLNLSAFEGRSSFKTWVMKIMLNKCYRKTQKFSFKNEITDDSIIDERSTPLYSSNRHTDTNKIIMNKELNRVIEESLMRLSLEYRMVFLLREIDGLSVAETAEALDLTESNVKVRLNRAKVMMRKEIEKSYSKEDIFEFNLVYCDMMANKVMSKIEMLEDKSRSN
jgi:RNA polymerase sigma factor (sigma-70 family)